MHSSYCITNIVNINYNYIVSSDQLPVNQTTCTSVSQIVTPSPLIICKSSNINCTSLGRSFYYKVTLTNISSYPIYVYIYDNIPDYICCDNFSFIKNKQCLPYVDFSKWIYIGRLSPCSCTSISYRAALIADYNINSFSNEVYGYYYQNTPDCTENTWNMTKSNECIIGVIRNEKF